MNTLTEMKESGQILTSGGSIINGNPKFGEFPRECVLLAGMYADDCRMGILDEFLDTSLRGDHFFVDEKKS